MPKPQIPTLCKGIDEIAAAMRCSPMQVYKAKKDPNFPIFYIGNTPFMDTEAFRQWLGVKAEPREPSEEQIQAAVRQYIKEKLGEG